jgi:hypothetical protein
VHSPNLFVDELDTLEVRDRTRAVQFEEVLGILISLGDENLAKRAVRAIEISLKYAIAHEFADALCLEFAETGLFDAMASLTGSDDSTHCG